MKKFLIIFCMSITVLVLGLCGCDKRSNLEKAKVDVNASEYYSAYYSKEYQEQMDFLISENDRLIGENASLAELSQDEITSTIKVSSKNSDNQNKNINGFEIYGLNREYTDEGFGIDSKVNVTKAEVSDNKIDFFALVSKVGSTCYIGIKFIDCNDVVVENSVLAFKTNGTTVNDTIKYSIYAPNETVKIELYNK